MHFEKHQPPAIEVFGDPERNKTIGSIQGSELLGGDFLENHDIFHGLCEAPWFKEKYKDLLTTSGREFQSFSFHGEGLIELFSRFFGNCNLELITYGEQKYIQMPLIQKGVKENQPYRIFPLHKSIGYSDYSLEEYTTSVFSCIRYTIIGSLVSGDIVDKFILEYNSKLPTNRQNRDYYRFKEFVYEIHNYLLGKSKLTAQTQLLNNYLQDNYNSSFETTIEAVKQYINFFYKQVIEIDTQKPIVSKQNVNFPIFKGDQITLLGQAYYHQQAIRNFESYYGYSDR